MAAPAWAQTSEETSSKAVSPAEAASEYIRTIEEGETIARQLGEVEAASQFIRMNLIEALKANDWTEAERNDFIARTEDAFEAVDARNDAIVKDLLGRVSWEALYALDPEFMRIVWSAINHSNDLQWKAEVIEDGPALVARGMLNPQSFANLSDRLSLKQSGKQTYGTQIECLNGEAMPKGSGDIEQFAAKRAELGLPSMAQYLEEHVALYGECPAPKE